MTHFIKQVDPLKVARLKDVDYGVLMEAVELISGGTKEHELPPSLYASAFLVMRKIGPSDLRCYNGMKVTANSIKQIALTIAALRTPKC